MTRSTLLVLSQTYVPDTPSVGQHMHDAAAALAARGHRVIVLTSARGYDDPEARFPKREARDGVEIKRLPLCSFGKGRIAVRLIGGLSFCLQAAVRGVFTRGLKGIVVSTSPPMAPLAAFAIRLFRRRCGVLYWAMDLNPDQAIAMGKTTPGSLPARLFEWLNRLTLRRSDRVVALDDFMAARLGAKVPESDLPQRTVVMPPWPHVDADRPPLDHAANPFRREHGLDGKFVVMYSGNLSIAHPIDTLLEAAVRLKDHPRLFFLFVGGGLGAQRVREVIAEHDPPNMKLLPYQPLERLPQSLSAADVHLVAMGDDMVGIVHPCKVYGAMAVGRPILLLGPRASHVGRLLDEHDIGWHIDRGDPAAAAATLERIAQTPAADLEAIGTRARRVIADDLSPDRLTNQFVETVEQTLPPGRSSGSGSG